MERSRKPQYQPGWFSMFGGLIGAAAATTPPLTPISFQITAGSTIVGAGIDVACMRANDDVGAFIRRHRAIFGKLREDHRQSVLHDWPAIEAAHVGVLQRLLSTKLARLDDARLRSSDNLASLKRYLVASRCWEGAPRPESIALLKALGPWGLGALGPWRINSASLNAGLEAALMVLNEDYGVPLTIERCYAHGIEQVSALNKGDHFDFAIMADPNVFMTANAKTANDYRFLLPCGWQTNHIVRRRAPKSYDAPRVWYAAGSSGEEQLLLGLEIGIVDRDARAPLSIEDISDKIDELDEGEAVIAWEPLITLHGVREKSFEAAATSKYRLSTSLYCQRLLNSTAAAPVRNAFQDCLIASWNLARIYQIQTSLRMLLDPAMHDGYRRILDVM